MKVFTLGVLLALYGVPAIAAGTVSRIIPGSDITTTGARVTESTASVDDTTRSTGATTRTSTGATSTTRDTASTASRTATTRNVSRVISTPAVSNTATRAADRSGAISRSQTASDTTRSNLESAVRNVGRSSRTDAASINSNPAVRRMGLTLRPSTAEVGGRAIMSSGAQTGSNIATEINNLSRIATIKTREEKKLDATAIADAKERLEQTAALNKSCQEQYNDCMDQFCAVVDANQKRCSCSSNLSKYAKVEQAVRDANAQLNEVAQNIRYVGLSADEITAIMSATEAEEAMTGVQDTTENRTLLAEIEKMIKDPKSTTTSYYGTDSFGLLDIDLDFASDDWSDIFSLDFLTNNNSGFSSLRGKDLYNAAKRRCNTVISQCHDVGATAQQITGNYDLAIDKDCIAYENGLNKMNETLVSNVRSANRMLQKARLAVLQNQNTYDARGCIAALETCMTDDMVCGEDYAKCLDPTKKYIDENGNVVLGQNINMIQKFMAQYNNADVNNTFLTNSYGSAITESGCSAPVQTADPARDGDGGDGHCIVKYLLSKIGTNQKATAEGLCRPVLDKCRAYTYDTRGNYLKHNDIVINYIQRAMVNIRAAQYQIVADYASTCLNDIGTCYNAQVSQVTSWAATASAASVYNIMRGACRNVALTCGYAIFAADQASCPPEDPATCIDSISEIFYQSLLCPDNSVYEYSVIVDNMSPNNTVEGFVNRVCRCREGYVSFNGACLPRCTNGGQYDNSGVCTNALSCDVVNGHETANGETPDFWGHCTCNSGTDGWFNELGRCAACPTGSVYQDNPLNNPLKAFKLNDYKCVCPDQKFLNRLKNRCISCPGNARYNPNATATSNICTCDEGLFYSHVANRCMSNAGVEVPTPASGGDDA